MIPAKYWSPTKKLMMLGAMAGGKLVEDTATGNPLTFLTDLARPLKSLLIPFTPQQSGTGDPSPQNIRSILPWNGLKVWNGGKNLFNKDIEPYKTGMYISEVKNAMVGYTENANYNVYRIPVKSNTYYTFGRIKASTPMYAMLNEQGYVVNSGSNDGGATGTYKTIITTNTTKYLLLSVAVNGTYKCDDILQLEEGETHTEYEPITETDIPFASPVYGGTLDVVSGVLTVECVSLAKTWGDFSNKTSLGDNTRGTLNISAYPSKPSIQATDAKCNIAPRNTGWSTDSVHFYTNEGSCIVFLPNDTDASTEIQVVYPLATPNEISLTPEQITALVGDNTIWSDADGSMTAVYLKKG